MSARTYLCLPCRWSRRAEAAYGRSTSLRCPTCGGSLWELEWRWRIPRKTNDKGWQALAAKVASDAVVLVLQRRRLGAAKLAKIEAQIANVDKQRDSTNKTSRIKKLRQECAQTLTRYTQSRALANARASRR